MTADAPGHPEARTADERAVRTLSICSGKGGVGKTNVSVNLAMALARRGRRVVLLDADLAMANVDVLLGLQPRGNLAHVVAGERELADILMPGPHGLRVVPAASGVAALAGLSNVEHAGLIHAFSELSADLDTLVVDIAAGISDAVTSFVGATQEAVVVVCDEPASITDAYALVKVLSRDHGITRFRILASMVADEQEGRRLHRKLATVCERFLSVAVLYLGSIPRDDYVRRAVQRQAAVVDAYPRSRASRAFDRLAAEVEGWPLPAGASGRIEFFLDRLIGSEGAPA
jgi:flagellar biosynthesis protein FlhG